MRTIFEPTLRDRYRELAGNYADAWIAAFRHGEHVDRVTLWAKWAASYALDALDMREDRFPMTLADSVFTSDQPVQAEPDFVFTHKSALDADRWVCRPTTFNAEAWLHECAPLSARWERGTRVLTASEVMPLVEALEKAGFRTEV